MTVFVNTDDPFFRILCVDDDRRMRQAFTLGFGEYGFEVITASHGIDAMMQFRAEDGNFGVLLIDHGGADAQGLEFIRQVRALGYEGRVLLMGERLSAAECQAYQDSKLSGLFSKPFDISMVATMLLLT
jgi:DNA-binding response OmpR family regulator